MAVVVAKTLAGQVIKFFAEMQRNMHFESRVFFSREEGLEWLRQQMAEFTQRT